MSTAVADLDDQGLQDVENRAHPIAMDLIRGLFPMQPTPRKDAQGTLRHGFGRPIEKRPMTDAAASFVLADDLRATQATLRGRVFELIAVHPEAEDRLPYLYAIGDLLGAEKLRDWSALWEQLRRQDWQEVGVELMTAQWDKYYASGAEKRRAVMGLILKISAPVAVAA